MLSLISAPMGVGLVGATEQQEVSMKSAVYYLKHDMGCKRCIYRQLHRLLVALRCSDGEAALSNVRRFCAAVMSLQ